MLHIYEVKYKKTYPMEFSLEVFICKWYNWEGAYDVNVIYNRYGNKQGEERLAIKHRTNSVPPKGSPWWVPMGDGMTVTSPLRIQWL